MFQPWKHNEDHETSSTPPNNRVPAKPLRQPCAQCQRISSPRGDDLGHPRGRATAPRGFAVAMAAALCTRSESYGFIIGCFYLTNVRCRVYFAAVSRGAGNPLFFFFPPFACCVELCIVHQIGASGKVLRASQPATNAYATQARNKNSQNVDKESHKPNGRIQPPAFLHAVQIAVPRSDIYRRHKPWVVMIVMSQYLLLPKPCFQVSGKHHTLTLPVGRDLLDVLLL
jgi:hypothetical protein